MYELNKGNIPIRSWIPPYEIESGAIDQATNLSQHPQARVAVVLLPDVHRGYGICIGAVAAFEDHISPAGVGYDISCGVRALRTSIRVEELDRRTLTRGIMSNIRARIPLGEGGRRQEPAKVSLPEVPKEGVPIVEMHLSTAPLQLGTLGGGE